MNEAGQVTLWGPNHTELGEVEVRSLGRRIAIAISRGLRKKSYWHVDPNEDIVAAVEGNHADLLIVADGHRGCEASEEAVKSVLKQLGEPPAPDLGENEWVTVFHQAGEAVLRKTQSGSCPNTESRTTLTVALISGSNLQWASMGDASLFLVSGAEAKPLGRKRSRYVGYPMTTDEVRAGVSHGMTKLPPASWIVLATDGFTDFAPFNSPEAAVEEALERGAKAADIARQLVALAFEGGAGDNVAVAVFGPTG